MWRTPVSPMTTPLPSLPRGFTDRGGVPEEGKSMLTECEDHPSSDDSAGLSGENRKKAEEVWELEELEAGSFNYRSSRQASDQSTNQRNTSVTQKDSTDEEEHHR